MFEQIQYSIQLLVEYLRRDSERYYTLNGNELHIFRNAVNSGGYEKYLQAVYASVKQAYLAKKVFMEFDVTPGENYPRKFVDIAYKVYNNNDFHYFCIEELKCNSKTLGFNYFLCQYKQDINKVAYINDFARVVIDDRYVVGFIAYEEGYIGEMKKECVQMIKDVKNYINKFNISGDVWCTQIYSVDGLCLCAVITRVYKRNTLVSAD